MHVLNLCVCFTEVILECWLISLPTHISSYSDLAEDLSLKTGVFEMLKQCEGLFYEINVYKQEENHKRTQKYKNKCLQIQGRGEKQAGEFWQYIRSDETKID